MLACTLQDSILRLENSGDGRINRLTFGLLDLLGLELCLLKSELRFLSPLLEIAEIRLEFSKEGTHFALVITLAGCRELALIDRDREVGVFRRQRPSVSVLL